MVRLNPNLVAVVKLLQDLQFHTGTELGKCLGVSRVAIWKMVAKLIEYQMPITSVKGKGYALTEPLLLLDKQKIQDRLTALNIHHLNIFESISSTQIYLCNQPPTTSFEICVAELQTQGRGRLNRSWYSPFGKNLYMSVSRLLKKDLSQLTGLTLVVAMSLAKAIDDFCCFPKPVLIKWPNDLLYNGMKLAGILVEVFAEANGFSKIIIGIGVNVNLKNEELTLDAPWTSLHQISGHYYDRNAFLLTVVSELTQAILHFEEKGFTPFVSEWHKRDYLHGQLVNAAAHSQQIVGQVAGITSEGHLKIKKNNQMIVFSAGDISLHKTAEFTQE